MQVYEFLIHAMVALLSGYLALSGALAGTIQNLLAQHGLYEEPSPQEREVGAAIVFPRPLTILPTDFAKGRPIFRALLDNLEYQQAAVVSAEPAQTTSNSTIEEALVNIFCTYKSGEAIRSTTGSGVFIDSRGIILTNAHVAQFLLLEGTRDSARCTIRQGSPAEDKFEADILYISPLWLDTYASLIDTPAPTGTGERDYALLYVTNATQGEMPTRFPALAYDTTPLTISDHSRAVRVAGYPADIFSSQGPKAELQPIVGATRITELFTFGGYNADVMAIASSSVGEQGSSGGPVVGSDGSVIGLIVTRGAVKDGTRSLRALTLPYINTTIKEETGLDLKTTLRGDLKERSKIFKGAMNPFIAQTSLEE